jgi:hypothetical protein
MQVRLEDAELKALDVEAKKNSRSRHAEVVHRIRESLEGNTKTTAQLLGITESRLRDLDNAAKQSGRSIVEELGALIEKYLPERAFDPENAAVRTLTDAARARIETYLRLVSQPMNVPVAWDLFVGALAQLGAELQYAHADKPRHAAANQIGCDIGQRLAFDIYDAMNRPRDSLSEGQRALGDAARALGIKPLSDEHLAQWENLGRVKREGQNG